MLINRLPVSTIQTAKIPRWPGIPCPGIFQRDTDRKIRSLAGSIAETLPGYPV